jgi:hypothetical protein
VNRLTRGERIVLVTLIGLFIVGWTAKFWRQRMVAGPVPEAIGR